MFSRQKPVETNTNIIEEARDLPEMPTRRHYKEHPKGLIKKNLKLEK